MPLPHDRSKPLHLAVRYRVDSVIKLQQLTQKITWLQRLAGKLEPYTPVYSETFMPPAGSGTAPPPALPDIFGNYFQWAVPRG